MNKKKIFLILGVCAVAYFVAAAIGIYIFHAIRDNPIDTASLNYLWKETDFEEKYGEIVHANRNFKYSSEENDTVVKRNYRIETETQAFIVRITIEKSGDNWKGISYEVLEVIPDGK